MNMKQVAISPLQLVRPHNRLPPLRALPFCRCLHRSSPYAAIPLPSTAAGPPPSAPIPAASQYGERVDRRRRQAEMLKKGQELRSNQEKPGNAMKKRFWKDVFVKTDLGMTVGTVDLMSDSFNKS